MECRVRDVVGLQVETLPRDWVPRPCVAGCGPGAHAPGAAVSRGGDHVVGGLCRAL